MMTGYFGTCQYELMHSGLPAYQVCMAQENIDAQYRLLWGGLIIVGCMLLVLVIQFSNKHM